MNDYTLLCCQESPHDGRVYYVKNGKRRWIPSGEHIKHYSFAWEDIKELTANQIASYALMSPLPDPTLIYDPGSLSVGSMHEFIGKQINGKGIEFGAASSPFPTALDSEVDYADLFDHNSSDSPYFNHHSYARNEYVKCRYLTGIDKMTGIPDGSLDFVIACHVIEHVSNPLLAMETAWHKLRPGGKLVLLVPHRDLTFDKARELTKLEHLILDYKRPLK